jgi:DNA polymerase
MGAGEAYRPTVSDPPFDIDDTMEPGNWRYSSRPKAASHSVNYVNSVEGGLPLANPLFLDFETRNIDDCDLTKAGAWRYAADPATEVLTLVFAYGGGETQLWTPADGLSDPLLSLATDPGVTFVSFGDFDAVIWAQIMVGRFGFPAIPTPRWHNAQAAASYCALPRQVGKLLPVIGADVAKDNAGRRLVLSLSRRDRKTGEFPELTHEIRQRVYEYNKTDVVALVAIHRAAGTLPERERRVWETDQAINSRGILIDTTFVRAAKDVAESSKGVLLDEFATLTDGLSPHQVDAMRGWLKGRGFPLPNLQDETLNDVLENIVLPDDVRRALQVRQALASTSLRKLDAMLACAGADGRARGLFQYHAATPGRWSAQLLQPQNLPRPTVDIDIGEIEQLVDTVKAGDAAALTRWGEPLEVLSSALRFALVAADGHRFSGGDYSMIEVCVLLGLAGQHDKTKLIADGVDSYRDMAATIYDLDRDAFQAIPVEELNVEQQQQRQAGKVTVLGCGYQMGTDAFRSRYLRHMGLDEGKKFAEEVVKVHYRKRWAPNVPKLWYALENAACQAMANPGKTVHAIDQSAIRSFFGKTPREFGVSYRLDTQGALPCLICILPNGKAIRYQNARVTGGKDAWGRVNWTYWAYRRGQWREVDPYGGQLTENVVQSLARELLVDAILRLESRGFPVVMHCHDEIVVEHPTITKETIEEFMSEPPEWAVNLGIPIKVKGWINKRYRK